MTVGDEELSRPAHSNHMDESDEAIAQQAL